MNNYNAYGLKIKSELDFWGKSCINGKEDLVIKLGEINCNCFKKISNGDDFWIGANNHKDIIIKWDGIGKFKLSNGSEIIVAPETENREILYSYIMGPIMATLLYQRGLLVLHGSAIKTDMGVIAFLGPSGFGKSTIAMALNNKGYQVIADDILAIKVEPVDNPVVLPGFPQLKLSSTIIELMMENSEVITKNILNSEKYVIKFSDFLDGPLNIKKIYVLEKGPDSTIKDLKPQEALMRLIDNSYCSIMFQNGEKKLNFIQCVDLLKKVDVSLLKVNHAIDLIPELVQQIGDDIFHGI
ncbi:hypothetical protein [Methanobacterium sp. ACI-7]|uniref:hypothetical protein n=1 Tax=unclassified Methanobacterium TaxID=2627676 RepID=UPI0039C2CB41